MYNWNNYNDPKTVGNKNMYAFGGLDEDIRGCGFIHADTKTQAKLCLNAYNEAWCSHCYLKDYSKTECENELLRRKMAAQSK